MKNLKNLVKNSNEFKNVVKGYNNGESFLLDWHDCKSFYERLGKPTIASNYGSDDLEDWERFIYLIGECLVEETDCKMFYYSEGLSI